MATTPTTTIVPFTALPSCAIQCGALYDANGACVPPVATATDEASWDSCFCAYNKLQPFSTGTAGVCDGACPGDPTGLSGIQSWFTSLCGGNKAAASASPTSSSTSSNQSNGGGDWLSTHWQWVIMIVVVVVGIAAIWTGACVWRRKYLKKKDRLHELGKGLPSSVAVNTQGNLVATTGARDSTYSPGPGMFMSGSGGAAAVEEKPKKKRWNLSGRE
ncbi:hypothetical protein F4780DRAFT_678839 [Xylariomycetidae sp. FL0641]|nr:hypothetical protein F4780DRAFT_678839 [Xylariomycetidae sp. FL0641]